MRTEATREEWNRLYQLAIKYRDMWEEGVEKVEFFSVRFSDEETVYFSILGNNNMCTGFSMYQGMEGLNDLMGLIFAEQMNLDFYDMVLEQNCISMRFGSRKDISKEQYQIISDLNLKFRGNGNWIYFETYEKGFYPYICDHEEVLAAIKYFEKFMEGIQYYKDCKQRADFKKGEFFEYCCDNGIWEGRIKKLPIIEYQYPTIHIADDFTRGKLKKAQKNKTGVVMEIKTFYYCEGVRDENYDKIIVPKIAAVADHYSGQIMDYRMILPAEDSKTILAIILAEWIYQYGCPREIIVSDSVTAALIEDVCKICHIKLTKGITSVIEDFRTNVREDAADKNAKEQEDFSYEYQDLYDDFDAPFFQVDLRNRKEKIQAVRDFYGQGKIEKKVMEAYHREIWVDYSITDWMNMLKESRKPELTALAAKIGIFACKGLAKEQIIREIQNRVVREPKVLADSMDKREKSLLKYLWQKAAKNGFEIDFDKFSFDIDVILNLLAMGVIDIGLEYDKYESDLLLEPVKEIELLLKNWI